MRQENPRLHNDSVEIINQVRIENNISPSAPPFPDLHEVNYYFLFTFISLYLNFLVIKFLLY